MENLSHHFMLNNSKSALHAHGHSHATHNAGDDEGKSAAAASPTLSHRHGDEPASCADREPHNCGGPETPAAVLDPKRAVVQKSSMLEEPLSEGLESPPLSPTAEDGHTHSCVAANTAANCWASQQSLAMENGSLKQQISAYMFEIGCVVHSFLIGEWCHLRCSHPFALTIPC